MAEMAELISVHEHADPDAQATVTDFIDYTEYLPSDLERALTLIGKLDQTYQNSTAALHELLKQYCELPRGDDKRASVLEAEKLRAEISKKLDLALHVREAAYVEATRLHDDMGGHKARLISIHQKLLALPKPPSRDPTPEPIPQIQNKRDSVEGARLKINGTRHPFEKLLGRPTPQVIVPGEVLPARHPDSPTASMYDDFTSSDSSSDEDVLPRHAQKNKKDSKGLKQPKPLKLKVPKVQKEKKERPPRPPRPHGVMGTNVHSAVAGISTSNALMLLDPPPEDAKQGSEHAPWMRLTEWEMAKLRKRMKKNAIWAPSDTMIRRELADAGRGPEAYHRARQHADETGEEFIDCDDLANRDKNEPLRPGEIPLAYKSIFNKGMSLNVQKKKKRETEAAQAKAELEKAADNLSTLGSKMSELFNKTSVDTQVGDKIVLKVKNNKRKRDMEDDGSAAEESKANAQLHSEIILATKPARKLQKKAGTPAESTTTITTTTTIPLAAPGSPPKRKAAESLPSSPTGTRKGKNVSIKEKTPVPSAEVAAATRPPSRQASRRPSVAIPLESPAMKDRKSRKSATPAPAPPINISRLRSRRQAPGPVTNSQEQGTAISIGKRKNKPKKKGGRKDAMKPEETSLITDEEVPIDPDEETYCYCGDVSYGDMICCENSDCEKEWFHFPCVGLTEKPPNRAKWWCPDCRIKLGLDG